MKDASSRNHSVRWSVFALCMLALPFVNDSNYFLYSLSMMLVFAFAGISWDLLGGQAGQLSLGHSVFFGIGAYTSALLAEHFGISPWVSMAVAAALAMVVSFIFFYPTFRFGLVGPFFALTTIGVAIIFELIVSNADILGGASGIMPPMKAPGIYWLQFDDQRSYYFIALAMVAAVLMLSQRLRHSRMGYQLAAIRGDEAAAEACGINVGLRKMQVTAISAALTAVGGVLYVQIVTFVDPTIFGIDLAIAIVLAPILGGSGTLLGPLVGAALLTAVNESIRVYVGADIPGLNLFVYGSLLIVVVLLLPEGIVPRFSALLARRARARQAGAATPTPNQ